MAVRGLEFSEDQCKIGGDADLLEVTHDPLVRLSHEETSAPAKAGVLVQRCFEPQPSIVAGRDPDDDGLPPICRFVLAEPVIASRLVLRVLDMACLARCAFEATTEYMSGLTDVEFVRAKAHSFGLLWPSRLFPRICRDFERVACSFGRGGFLCCTGALLRIAACPHGVLDFVRVGARRTLEGGTSPRCYARLMRGDGPVNHRYFDRFSIVHAAVGAAAERLGVPAWLAIGGQIVFEVFENDMKRSVRHIWPDPRPDGIENSVGDVASFVAGFYGSRALHGTPVQDPVVVGLGAMGLAIWTASLLPAKRLR